MQFRTGNEIRELFLRFFESKGHRRVHSSSLVPHNDPTLLFANAGMNQFKDLFLGAEKRDYTRATTSQKCVRAGGKHNDLENVGFTRRHLTFFEMLGNFSFGDYFKRDAIQYAWELVTSPEWMGLPKGQLYVTIFEGTADVPRDDEAEQYWLEVGVPKERILPMGMKDNFWQMGDTGPCGPCSEIIYERVDVTDYNKSLPFGEDDARYVEIWNLVFMQFERSAIGDGEGNVTYKLTPLPKPSIDTGMGLERVTSVLQRKSWIYETDLFTPLIEKAAELTGAANDVHNASLRIIADHARAATFLINDGVLPSNEGRGYVLRKIMRRGIYHGRLLGQEKPFLNQMVYAVRDEMKGAYPDLIDSADRVARVIEAEEKQFARVMEAGVVNFQKEFAPYISAKKKFDANNAAVEQIRSLDAAGKRHTEEFKSASAHFQSTIKAFSEQESIDHDLSGLHQPTFPGDKAFHLCKNYGLPVDLLLDIARDTGISINMLEFDAAKEAEQARAMGGAHDSTLAAEPIFPGEKAFHLYETYGLPLDFMVDAARDAGIGFDMEGFEAARAEEQARARASWKGGAQKTASPAFRELPKTVFEGYKQLESTQCEVLAIVKDGVGTPAAAQGDAVEIVLDHTSFYADSGGQIGDTGLFLASDGNSTVAEVTGCVMPVQGVRAHKALLKQELAVGDRVQTVVDGARRDAIRRNHTGTHLLHAALRQVLGTHVKQAGSLVASDRLRFDFSHFAQVAPEELEEIESIVNREVLSDTRVTTIEDVPIDVAINEYHAMALFGEKYGDKVRVVKIGDFSTELCGGTHTAATGQIGLLKLTSEAAVSSGVRRVEAISGFGSLSTFRRDFAVAQFVSSVAPAGGSLSDGLRAKLDSHEDEIKRLRRELEEMRMKSAAGSLDDSIARAVEVKGVKVVTHRADDLERGQLRTLVDNLKQKLGEGVVVLGSAQPEGKVAIIAGVTPGLVKRIQAGKLVGAVAKLVGGSGGGKAEIAEAGGKDPSQIDAALSAAPEIVSEMLA